MRFRSTNTLYTTLRTVSVKPRPSCQNQCLATTVPACTATCPCPRTAPTCSLVTSMRVCLSRRCTTSAVLSNTLKRSTPGEPDHELLQASGSGYEAPVMLAYSARNRSASIRIPVVASPKARRIEVRFPDPAANPYLCFAALLMAGLDGIKNKIHPGEAMDKTCTTCRQKKRKRSHRLPALWKKPCKRWTQTASS